LGRAAGLEADFRGVERRRFVDALFLQIEELYL
jgi:hypothetical protein